MNKTLLFLTLLLITYTLPAQTALEYCGTPAEKSDWLLEYQRAPENYAKGGNEIIYVPLTIHNVGTDAGTGYFSIFRLFDAICEVNRDFAPANIQFFVEGDIRYLNNTDFYDHEFDTGYRMMEENNVANTMNCYIVANPAGACGYSFYGLGIALGKGCTGLGSTTFAHELGHAFSLPHTFFGWEGTEPDFTIAAPSRLDNGSLVEKLDGSNCDSAGDGFCDTPPDYLNFRWSCDDTGMSTRAQLDPDTTRFVSDGTLFMSYSDDGCMTRFSDDQAAAMRANLLDERTNFLYNQTPVRAIEAQSLSVLSPTLDDTVAINEVVLNWEDVAGATHYYVEIGRTVNFSVVVERGIVTDSEFISTGELTPDKKHYWRVIPYNSHDYCTAPLKGTTFRTTEAVTNVADFATDFFMQVIPSLVQSDTEVNLQIKSPTAEKLTVTIYNVAGQQIQRQLLSIGSGKNEINLEVNNDLAKGLYFIKINNTNHQRVLKFVKQ